MADEERRDRPEGAPGEPGESAPEEAAPEERAEETAPEERPEEAAPEELAEETASQERAEAPEERGGDVAAEPGGEDAARADEAAGEDAGGGRAGEEAAGGDAAGEQPAAAADEQPAAAPDEESAPAGPAPRPRGRRGGGGGRQEEVIPGAHLEPDLVLEEQPEGAEAGEFAAAEAAYSEPDQGPEEERAPEGEETDQQPVAHEPLDLAADARYAATGKRKSAVARVILRPGDGVYTINGRHLDQFFPRVRLQRMAQQPLETAGYNGRMDVLARIHGGGVSAQAGALRHGIARALVEADPSLRLELKRRGFLTRDPREKERKKAGLKKARKRPQFSKR